MCVMVISKYCNRLTFVSNNSKRIRTCSASCPRSTDPVRQKCLRLCKIRSNIIECLHSFSRRLPWNLLYLVGYQMPILTVRFLSEHISGFDKNTFFKEYPIFVETGTLYGQTVFSMEPFFKSLCTIEIKKEYVEKAHGQYRRFCKKNRRKEKIRFYWGDSPHILQHVLSDIPDNAVFFLDGHWSGGDTGKGVKEVPLLEELTMIMEKFKHKAVIIIDDFRLFKKGPTDNSCKESWEDISKEKVLEIVQSRLTAEYHAPSKLSSTDRLVLHLKSNKN